MSKRVHAFTNEALLVESLSENIIATLNKAIALKGSASLIVSGGRTPQALFKRLSAYDIAWENVKIGLCDERWVSSENEDSNEKSVKQYLMQDKASKAEFVGMYEAGEAEASEASCSQKIRTQLMPFDVVVLGMGNDAHTASLFPNNTQLNRAFALDSSEVCIAIKPATAPHIRMSLTRSAILSATRIFLHFEGKEKIAVYNEVIAGDDMFSMPIRAILNQDKKDIEVYFR